jgi:hypothetical protein
LNHVKNDSGDEFENGMSPPAHPETTPPFALYGFDERPGYLGLISDFQRRSSSRYLKNRKSNHAPREMVFAAAPA